MNNTIKALQRLWLDWRKPWSVALVGIESGNMSMPLSFIRFKTYEDAAVWVLQRELSAHPCVQKSRWVIVDLRQIEQLEHQH